MFRIDAQSGAVTRAGRLMAAAAAARSAVAAPAATANRSASRIALARRRRPCAGDVQIVALDGFGALRGFFRGPGMRWTRDNRLMMGRGRLKCSALVKRSCASKSLNHHGACSWAAAAGMGGFANGL